MKNYFKNKTILVTGGGGAMGSRLVQTLSRESRKIFVIDDLSAGNNIIIKGPNIEFHKASILNSKLLDKIFKQGVDVVFHLAANFANQNSVEHPEKDLMVNGLGTLLLLEYAQRYKTGKFVFTSSSCVYGNQKQALEEKQITILLDTPYAVNKLLGEMYCYYFHEHYGLDITIFRIFNCYGPGEKPGKYRNVIPNFINLALQKKPLPVFGTGRETRDFNFVDDVINKILYVSSHAKSAGGTYNVGSGKDTPIITIAKEINRLTANPAGIKFMPRRSWDHILHRRANINKLKKLNYFSKNKKETPLEEGILKTIEFIKSL